MSKLDKQEQEHIAAHELWTELHTRIATRPLAYRSGTEHGALDSLFKLSQWLREAIAKYPDADQFRGHALTVMQLLTNHLSEWHPRRDEQGHLRLLKQRHEYRNSLIALQKRLTLISVQVHSLCHAGACPEHDAPPGRDVVDPVLPTALAPVSGNEKNDDDLVGEFKDLGLENRPAAGLALSGGGIRAATFSLGVIQTLQDKGVMKDFDYLSTVSGGGYLGSYISGGIAREKVAQEARSSHKDSGEKDIDFEEKARNKVYGELGKPESLRARWLRNNSKYLLKVRMRFLTISAILIHGILNNAATLIGLAMMAGLLAVFLPQPSELIIAAKWLAIVVLSYVALRPFIPLKRNALRFLDGIATVIGALSVMAVAACGIDWLAATMGRMHDNWLTGSGLGLGAASSALAAALAARQSFPAIAKFMAPKLLSFLALIVGPLVFLLVAVVTYGVADSTIKPYPCIAEFMRALDVEPRTAISVVALTIVLRALLANINRGGLRSYYRNRLRDCYGVAPRKPGERGDSTEVKLSDLPNRPFHIINMALNAPESDDPELRGRACDFFSATKRQCGSRMAGYRTTKDVEKGDSTFDLATAMATSGAAASSLMGRKSMKKFQFLMTLFNVRLGYWLRWRSNNWVWQPNATHLVREALGMVKSSGAFVNLSDGGHIENLAVYELLRRRVQYIVCIDGGCEPDMACFDLIRLQRYASIDLGIDFKYELDDLKPDASGHCPSYGTLVKIVYPGDKIGWMLYLKLATTGAESLVITEYRAANKAFPHETTADQFFDEEQFEAYRLLGETAGAHFFDDAFGTREVQGLRDWLSSLALELGPREALDDESQNRITIPIEPLDKSANARKLR